MVINWGLGYSLDIPFFIFVYHLLTPNKVFPCYNAFVISRSQSSPCNGTHVNQLIISQQTCTTRGFRFVYLFTVSDKSDMGVYS